MAHKIDLFLDQETTTAMIDPKPMPPSIALLLILFFSDSANSSDEVMNREKIKKINLITN
jgi:hypothetical protein